MTSESVRSQLTSVRELNEQKQACISRWAHAHQTIKRLEQYEDRNMDWEDAISPVKTMLEVVAQDEWNKIELLDQQIEAGYAQVKKILDGDRHE